MIEPTETRESRSRSTGSRMSWRRSRARVARIPGAVRRHRHTTPVRRLDEARAAKDLEVDLGERLSACRRLRWTGLAVCGADPSGSVWPFIAIVAWTLQSWFGAGTSRLIAVLLLWAQVAGFDLPTRYRSERREAGRQRVISRSARRSGPTFGSYYRRSPTGCCSRPFVERSRLERSGGVSLHVPRQSRRGHRVRRAEATSGGGRGARSGQMKDPHEDRGEGGEAMRLLGSPRREDRGAAAVPLRRSSSSNRSSRSRSWGARRGVLSAVRADVLDFKTYDDITRLLGGPGEHRVSHSTEDRGTRSGARRGRRRKRKQRRREERRAAKAQEEGQMVNETDQLRSLATDCGSPPPRRSSSSSSTTSIG